MFGEYVNMTDQNPPAEPIRSDEEDLRQSLELLFFAYRDLTAGADAVLAEYGFGRAHHRVIYFVGRNAGITVSDLLDILRITKQSLGRVLGQLVLEGFIIQRPGARDRRQRLLDLTEKGVALERRLTGRQIDSIARACAGVDPLAVEGFRQVLLGLVDASDRSRFSRRPATNGGG